MLGSWGGVVSRTQGSIRKTSREAGPVSETHSELSLQLLRAQEEERKRISRELHDETGQALMLLRLQLAMLRTENPGCQEKVRQVTELLDRTIGGLRRIISRLSPRVLEEVGLLAAIRKEARELGKNTAIKVRLNLPSNLGNLSREIEIAAYRCVQEALHNVTKHSRAHNVSIELWRSEQRLTLLIQDDGIGISDKQQVRTKGFGLIGMRDRIAVLGGTVRISSQAGGTRVRIFLPIGSITTAGKPEPHTAAVPIAKPAVVSRAS